MSWVGSAVKRIEDPALLTGRGRFVDDIHLPQMLHAAFVRSPFGHAKVSSVDAAAAAAMPGVRAVLVAGDLPRGLREQRMPLLVPNPAIRHPVTQRLLAATEVCFVGEPVAVVLAETPHRAEDAAEAVVVEYDPLPAVSDWRAALEPGAPAAHQGRTDNVAAEFRVGYGDVEGAFAGAAHVVHEVLHQHRGAAHPLECRGVLGAYDPATESTTIWANTQSPHQLRDVYARVTGESESRVRVVAPDTGGGFGPKALSYPEQVLIPVLARMFGQPIKWIEDRREHFLSTTQERDQLWDVAAAFDSEGRLLGVRGRLLHDSGAYVPWGIVTPYISATTVPGPYVLPAYRMDVTCAFTNKVATTPVRGAGRPQAAFAMERLLNRGASVLGLDPAEIRRRNLIPPSRMPYAVGLTFRDGSPVVYDSGDYPKCQEMALSAAGYANFAERRCAARAEGRYIGIGIANYVEGTGLGPFEGATVRVLRDGRVLVETGGGAQGQGHRTMFAQIVADQLGIDPSTVEVRPGDTADLSHGIGTFASRIAANAGPSAQAAALAVREKAVKVAAHMLEAAEADLEIADGRVFVKGVPEHGRTFAEIAGFANGMPGFSLPKGIEAGLDATRYFTPERSTYANGCHVVTVEVDVETGAVAILDYWTGHDCGTRINPMMVDGQVVGGVAHGIGNALYEWLRYDDEAQPLTASFADYAIPGSLDVPRVRQTHMESPTPLNPLGVKGAGEGGTIPAAAAIVAAIEDALAPLGVRIDVVPVTPPYLLEKIEEAQARLQESTADG